MALISRSRVSGARGLNARVAMEKAGKDAASRLKKYALSQYQQSAELAEFNRVNEARRLLGARGIDFEEFERGLYSKRSAKEERQGILAENQLKVNASRILESALKYEFKRFGNLSPIGQRAISILVREMLQRMDHSVIARVEGEGVLKALKASPAFQNFISAVREQNANSSLREEAIEEVGGILQQMAEQE